MCKQKSKLSTQSKPTHSVNPVEEDYEEIGIFRTMSENSARDESYLVDVEIEGVQINMELDTGAVVSIIPESM